MASASFANCSEDAGSGSPDTSYPAPPTGASCISRGSPSLRRTLVACATISGPMPSPGSTAILTSEIPGVLRFALRFEGADLVSVAQREADLVQPVQQAILAEGVDVEAHFLGAVNRRHRLPVQIHSQLKSGKGGAIVEQPIHFRLAQHHGQEAVLERVGEEDVGERGRDHAAKAVVHQRPGRVLARGAAAEVLAREQDGGAPVARLVEHELRVLAPFAEQPLGKTGALDRRQILFRDDLVGVDVAAVERRDEAAQNYEFVHFLMSTK